MASMDGPSDEGLMKPDADALLIAQRKAEIKATVAGQMVGEPQRLDPETLMEQRKVEVKKAAEKAAVEPPVLTPEEENEVVDLLTAGRKERSFELFGRVINLRTLTIDEELKIGEITKPYVGTDAYPRAYRTAVVAAAIRTLDGELLFNPISESEFDNFLAKKFEKLLDWYPLAVDQIFARYRDMELELLALVEKLGKYSG